MNDITTIRSPVLGPSIPPVSDHLQYMQEHYLGGGGSGLKLWCLVDKGLR